MKQHEYNNYLYTVFGSIHKDKKVPQMDIHAQGYMRFPKESHRRAWKNMTITILQKDKEPVVLFHRGPDMVITIPNIVLPKKKEKIKYVSLSSICKPPTKYSWMD